MKFLAPEMLLSSSEMERNIKVKNGLRVNFSPQKCPSAIEIGWLFVVVGGRGVVVVVVLVVVVVAVVVVVVVIVFANSKLGLRAVLRASNTESL